MVPCSFTILSATFKVPHNDVSLINFPWNRVSTPIDRVNTLKTFTFILSTSCLDSLVNDAKKLDSWQGWSNDEIILNLYDLLVLSFDSSSTINSHKQFFADVRKNIPKYSKLSDKDILERFSKCVSDGVELRSNELDQILREEWAKKHQDTITLVADILNLVYGMASSLILLFFIRRLLTKVKI